MPLMEPPQQARYALEGECQLVLPQLLQTHAHPGQGGVVLLFFPASFLLIALPSHASIGAACHLVAQGKKKGRGGETPREWVKIGTKGKGTD
mmetsp:Transcript_7768/g.15123  ORF Transcript_7768/g.15123 Transcript_7768/m.15123 type:complete len:92 (-) Transcript_7768:2094-2369(-)